jgi:hypothetical protein
MITSDPNHPGINKETGNGQNEAYLVLSAEEIAKGFIRPVRTKYIHSGLKPKYKLRKLTEEESNRYVPYKYVAFEAYPAVPRTGVTGRYWTQAQLDVGRCGAVTTMPLQIAETYARDNHFYGMTFCCACGKHLSVEEFTWEDGTVVGS